MTLLLAALLLIVMAICASGPGFFLLRNLRWSTDERICASIGLSLVLTYLIATAIYLFDLPWMTCWIWTGLCAIGLIASRTKVHQSLRKSHVRRQLAGFAMLLLLGMLLLSTIRHYSGGQWFADWLLHYQRAIFFLHRENAPANLFGGDVIPSRPPLMNLLASFFLAHVGDGFDLFQIIFLFLNLLVLFPCVLTAGLLVRFSGRKVWLIASLLALNPMVLQNSTWTWTKLLAAFFLLVCLAFYLRGWKKDDPGRMIAGALAMAAAMLVHYSAGPYAVAMALHYLLIVRRRSHPAMEMIGGGLAAGALLMSWFAWSLAIYGWNGTVYSNTSVIDSQKLTFTQNIEKVGQNIVATFIPHPLHASEREFQLEFAQPSRYGFIRDYFFQIYQTNLPCTWGLFGWLGVGLVLIRKLARADRSDRRFWLLTLSVILFLGIATHGSLDPYGLSHICLQPITLLGLALLAGGFSALPRRFAGPLVIMLGLDAALGIALQFRMESYQIPYVSTPGLPVVDLASATLSESAIMNSALRYQSNIVLWADHFAWMKGPIQLIAAILLCGALAIFAGVLGKKSPFAAVAVAVFAAAIVACSLDDAASSNLAAGAASTAQTDDPIEAGFRAGISAYQLGQLDQARDALVDAFLLNPDDPRSRYALRVLLLPHGIRLADTDAAAAENFLHHRDDALVLAALSDVLYRRGFHHPAIDRLEQALRIDPLLPNGLNRLRTLLAEQGMGEPEIQKILEPLRPVR